MCKLGEGRPLMPGKVTEAGSDWLIGGRMPDIIAWWETKRHKLNGGPAFFPLWCIAILVYVYLEGRFPWFQWCRAVVQWWSTCAARNRFQAFLAFLDKAGKDPLFEILENHWQSVGNTEPQYNTELHGPKFRLGTKAEQRKTGRVTCCWCPEMASTEGHLQNTLLSCNLVLIEVSMCFVCRRSNV